MGVKSTYYIDRKTALELIMRLIDTCANENLENILEELDESSFRNFAVYDQLPDDVSEDRIIEDVGDF